MFQKFLPETHMQVGYQKVKNPFPAVNLSSAVSCPLLLLLWPQQYANHDLILQ